MARQSWVPIVGGLVLVGGVVVVAATGIAVIAMMGAPAMPYEAMRIVDAYGIRPSLAREIVNVAREAKTHPYWLADLIYFESGREFTSHVTNPTSGATGLIQFTKTTAKRLKITLAELAAMSEEEQMGWVLFYLQRVSSGLWPDDLRAMPLNTPQRLFMSVFYPEARDWPLGKAFPVNIQDQNKGIITVADYIADVMRLGKLSHLVVQEAA